MSDTRIRAALEKLLSTYVDIAESGDCDGYWDPDSDELVIEARAALAAPLTHYEQAAGRLDRSTAK